MFRPLLGVGQQALGEGRVLLRRLAPRTRARQRSHGDVAVHHADHDLGRTAYQRGCGGPQVEHERAWVHHPQRAVEFERGEGEGHLQTPTEHHLEDVAGANVFDGLLGGGQKLLAGRCRPGRPLGEASWLPSRADVGRRRPRARCEQPVDRFVDTAAGLRVATGRGRGRAVVDVGQHHDVERLGDVVENKQTIVEGEREVGEMEVVDGWMGQPLRVADGVVGGIPHGTAGERREFRQVRRLVDRHPPLEVGERVRRLKLLHLVRSGPGDPHLRTEGFEPHERLGAEEAVAADLLATDDALEQAGGFPRVDSGKRRQGRESVGKQPPVDRHKTMSLR